MTWLLMILAPLAQGKLLSDSQPKSETIHLIRSAPLPVPLLRYRLTHVRLPGDALPLYLKVYSLAVRQRCKYYTGW